MMYGFIRAENLHYIDFLDVADKVQFNLNRSMFYLKWLGDTPNALSGILEKVLSDTDAMIYIEEEFNG